MRYTVFKTFAAGLLMNSVELYTRNGLLASGANLFLESMLTILDCNLRNKHQRYIVQNSTFSLKKVNILLCFSHI